MKGPRTKCPHCREHGIILRNRIFGSRKSGIICELCGTRFRRSFAWELVSNALAFFIFVPSAVLIFIFVPLIGAAAAAALSLVLVLLFIMYNALISLTEDNKSSRLNAQKVIVGTISLAFIIFFLVPSKEVSVPIIVLLFLLAFGYMALVMFKEKHQSQNSAN